MIRVLLNSVREAGPRDDVGASAFVIGERETPVYEGTPEGAAAALEELGDGLSVCVRHPGGLRSCMNKPSLRQWVREL